MKNGFLTIKKKNFRMSDNGSDRLKFFFFILYHKLDYSFSSIRPSLRSALPIPTVHRPGSAASSMHAAAQSQ